MIEHDTMTRDELLRGRGQDPTPTSQTPTPPAPGTPTDEAPAPIDPPGTCRLCSTQLPPGRSAYCSPECSKEADRKRARARYRATTATPGTGTTTPPAAVTVEEEGPRRHRGPCSIDSPPSSRGSSRCPSSARSNSNSIPPD